VSRITIGKWGASLAVRLPKQIAEEMNLTEDMKLESRVENGKLILEPVLDKRRRSDKYSLDDLLAQITPENVHEETGTGDAVGNEQW
jgi:antitoxin MazE